MSGSRANKRIEQDLCPLSPISAYLSRLGCSGGAGSVASREERAQAAHAKRYDVHLPTIRQHTEIKRIRTRNETHDEKNKGQEDEH